ncbi:MAG: hypothetical protein NTY01_06795 [Verrucomicrobia bacterium]|nr:hypothetical protein [Verrucomicrobiota bacterium]
MCWKDPEVFVLEAGFETGTEIASDGARGEVGEHPRAGRAAGDDLAGFFQVEAGGFGEGESFGHRAEVDRAEDLVDGFCNLAGAVRPDVEDGFAEPLEQRQRASEGFLVAADHDGERGLDGAFLAAGDGRVEEVRAFAFEEGGDSGGGGGRDGGVVHDDAAGAHAVNHADRFVRAAEDDGFEVGRVGDVGEDDVAGFGDGAGRVGDARAGGSERLGFGAGAVEDGERIAGAQEMAGHRAAHDAEADAADAGKRGAVV